MRQWHEGHALVSVLVLFLILTMFALAFIALMNSDQRLVGQSYRGTAALYLAEAGVQKTVWLLTHRPASGSQHAGWPSEGYQEALGSGRFVVETMTEDASVLALTVRGEVGGVARRVRLTARIAPKALGFGLFAGDAVAMTGQARAYVVPCLRPQRACHRLGDIALSRDLLLEREAALNALDGRRLALREGTLPDHALFGLSSAWADARLPDVLPDLVVTGKDELSVGMDSRPLNDLSALHRDYPGVHVKGLRTDEASMPSVDLEHYRVLAAANRGNQALNHAVGERMLDRTLREKKDSEYTPAQVEEILSYLEARRRQEREILTLQGVIFVEGIVNISSTLPIADGALVVRGTIQVMDRARLEVRHGPTTTTLPGVIAFGDGGMIRLGQGSVAVVDGIVLASVGIEVVKASVDVSGSILTGQGFVNDDGLVVIRYQPNVLTTVGLSRTEHVLIRQLSWQEVP
ncbi:MAG: hypothetical protein ACT4P5_03375 [Armatimonadota bacterium]